MQDTQEMQKMWHSQKNYSFPIHVISIIIDALTELIYFNEDTKLELERNNIDVDADIIKQYKLTYKLLKSVVPIQTIDDVSIKLSIDELESIIVAIEMYSDYSLHDLLRKQYNEFEGEDEKEYFALWLYLKEVHQTQIEKAELKIYGEPRTKKPLIEGIEYQKLLYDNTKQLFKHHYQNEKANIITLYKESVELNIFNSFYCKNVPSTFKKDIKPCLQPNPFTYYNKDSVAALRQKTTAHYFNYGWRLLVQEDEAELRNLLKMIYPDMSIQIISSYEIEKKQRVLEQQFDDLIHEFEKLYHYLKKPFLPIL